MFAFRKPDYVFAGSSFSGALSEVMLCEERDRKKRSRCHSPVCNARSCIVNACEFARKESFAGF